MSATTSAPTPVRVASPDAAGRDDHRRVDTRFANVVAPESSADHPRCGAQSGAVGGSRGTDQPDADAHVERVGAAPSFLLDLAAAALDDIERARIAQGNRIAAFERNGLGDLKEVQRARILHDALCAVEHDATLELQRVLRAHPLGPWVKRTVGVGEKQGARLIAAIGDPYWNAAADRPRRGPAELWAYCGLHTVPGDQTARVAPSSVVAGATLPAGDHRTGATHMTTVPGGNVRPRRRKGQRANWNSQAKMRAHLIAESCIKQMHSPYRAVYDRERAKWVSRETSDLHKHNHALGVLAKEVLKDLWRESKRLREAGA